MSNPQDSIQVARIIYYDDLEAECLTGGISMSARAYDVLWALCAEEQLTVIADVHTHPGSSVRQSPIDQRNPMMAIPGHLAFIVPHLATHQIAPSEVGAYEYQGEHTWRTIASDKALQIAGDTRNWRTVVLEWLDKLRQRWSRRWRR